jgi:hypothetical protein
MQRAKILRKKELFLARKNIDVEDKSFKIISRKASKKSFFIHKFFHNFAIQKINNILFKRILFKEKVW